MDGFEIQKADGRVKIPDGAGISLDGLRLIKVKHIGFDEKTHVGELVCDKRLAQEVVKIFEELYNAGYPIEKIRLAEEYGGDDDKIMSDNNSSCFNYRFVANTKTLSLHALGRAIDINPLYNPYIQNGVVMPENALAYADRTADFAHKITHDDLCFKIFARYGWSWGGDWELSPDYQHFYKPESRVKKVIRSFGK